MPPPKSAEVVSFGFDAVLRSGESILKVIPPYRLDPGITVRVGIVFQDPRPDRSTNCQVPMFTASKVHYHNRTFFLCKSTEQEKAICCTAGNYGAERSKPYRRIVCPIVIYRQQEIQEVRPWVFGNSAFRKLDEINQMRPLNTNDFFLQKSAQTMDPWDIQPCSGGVSLWQRDGITRDRVLGMAVPIFDHRREYLGKDLSNFEITQLLAQPSDRSRQVRQPNNPNRTEFDSFFQNIQARPRRRTRNEQMMSLEEEVEAAREEPSEPSRGQPDIDLDEILGNI
jgi:hypothetical protein